MILSMNLSLAAYAYALDGNTISFYKDTVVSDTGKVDYAVNDTVTVNQYDKNIGEAIITNTVFVSKEADEDGKPVYKTYTGTTGFESFEADAYVTKTVTNDDETTVTIEAIFGTATPC